MAAGEMAGEALSAALKLVGDGDVVGIRSFSVSAGSRLPCGVRRDGGVICWGLNDEGQATPPGGEFASVSVGWGGVSSLNSHPRARLGHLRTLSPEGS